MVLTGDQSQVKTIINLILKVCHFIGPTVTAAHLAAAVATSEVQVATLEVVLHVLRIPLVCRIYFFLNKDLDI